MYRGACGLRAWAGQDWRVFPRVAGEVSDSLRRILLWFPEPAHAARREQPAPELVLQIRVWSLYRTASSAAATI